MVSLDDALVTELRSLRRGPGLTPGSLSICEQLLQLVAEKDPVVAMGVLISRLNDLGEGQQARALRNAYGLRLLDPGTLKDRRKSFAIEEERHVDTIEDWENAAIRELLVRLRSPQPVRVATTPRLNTHTFRLTIVNLRLMEIASSSTSPRINGGMSIRYDPDEDTVFGNEYHYRAGANIDTLVISGRFYLMCPHVVVLTRGEKMGSLDVDFVEITNAMMRQVRESVWEAEWFWTDVRLDDFFSFRWAPTEATASQLKLLED